jgi:hypothetical protein
MTPPVIVILAICGVVMLAIALKDFGNPQW